MENTIFDVRRKMYRKNGKEEIQSLGEYYNEHTWINESGKMGCSYNLAVNQTFFSFFFFYATTHFPDWCTYPYVLRSDFSIRGAHRDD